MINNTRARNGSVYPYFVCLGRHQKRNDCTQAAIRVSDVEDARRTARHASPRTRPPHRSIRG
ncbi:zinc ribbon domain-containing protein [Microbacterium lacticum]